MIKFRYGASVYCDACDFYDVYMIDIDENRIELSDYNGMVIGTISQNEIWDKCEYIKFDKNGYLEQYTHTIWENGDFTNEFKGELK